MASTPQGLLRVTAAHDFGTTPFFAQMMLAFRERWPAVAVEVHLTPRNVDLVEEGFDLAFRPNQGTTAAPGSVMSRTLGRLAMRTYASAAYLERHGRPADAELAGHTLVEHEIVASGAQVLSNDFAFVLQAVLAGGGIGRLPTFLARPHVRAGELECVLPDEIVRRGRVTLLWPESRNSSPRVRAFIDFVVGYIAEHELFELG